MGGAYLKNRNQIINVGMIGRASSEDRRAFGGPGACSLGKSLKFEVIKRLKFTETVNPTIILNLLRSHHADLFGS